MATETHPATPTAPRICAAIVTYADRFSLLSEVVTALWREGVDRVVVVDNGASPASSAAIAALQDARTQVHRFPANQGSAAGFAKAIEMAAASGCDFVWVMDDDNRPEPGALMCLRAFWAARSFDTRRDSVVLSSFRRDRPNFVAALARQSPWLILPPRNAFAGFHLSDLAAKLRERLRRANRQPQVLPQAGQLSACAYGGLFCHRDLIARVGLPDVRYVLYMDDFAYTHAIVRGGGEIWLLRDSGIVDLEASFNVPVRKSLLYHSVFDAGRDAAVYYTFRNSIHFARLYATDSPAVYRINKGAFFTLMFVIGCMRGQFHRLRVLRQAVLDGEAGRLGRSSQFPL